MPKQRTRLQAADLTSGALIRSTKTGGIYRLGPPKKINVNLNVVNHCQLYYRNGKLVGTGRWFNLTNLREGGMQFYAPGPCTVPPPGWTCSRAKDHEGPCAARKA